MSIGAGVLFVTSGLSSHGMDLRANSVSDLDTLLRQQSAHVGSMHAHVGALDRQVRSLTHEVHDSRTRSLQQRVDRLRSPAGFTRLNGAGVTVTLNDAPASELNNAASSGATTADALLVHQQDIQAVVNALWAGGAQGVTVQHQRIIATTGIKCVGNTVVLNGVPYSPPYQISAVGNTKRLLEAINHSAYISAYKTFVRDFHLGWKLQKNSYLSLPPYTGTPDLRYAKRG